MNIKEIRKKRGLTQSDLGSIYGCSKQQISKWERGDKVPTLASLLKLAKILQVSLDELVK